MLAELTRSGAVSCIERRELGAQAVAPVALASSGLPIGVQIVGRMYDDLTTIAVAGMLEQGFHAFTPPPGWD